MPTYTITTDFKLKDRDNPVLWTELWTEFRAIEAALNLAANATETGGDPFMTNKSGQVLSKALYQIPTRSGTLTRAGTDLAAETPALLLISDMSGAQSFDPVAEIEEGQQLPIFGLPNTTDLALTLPATMLGRALAGSVEDFFEGINTSDPSIGYIPWMDVVKVGSQVFALEMETTHSEANGNLSITWVAA